MATITPHRLPAILQETNEQLTAANAVAYHCITLFLEDCKDLVYSHVKNSINTQMLSETSFIAKHGKARKKALGLWLKSDKPLSWNKDKTDSHGAYLQLLIILNEDPNTRPSGLRKAPESYTYLQLAAGFLKACDKNKAFAPISGNGAFLPSLSLGFTRIRRLISTFNKPDDNIIIAVFAKMMKTLNIHFVPWHVSDKSTSRAYIVRADWWMMLKAGPVEDINKFLPEEPEDEHAEVADHVQLMDPDAPWSLCDCLTDMGPLWNKVTLPSDWTLEAASLPATRKGDSNHYVTATYEYVLNSYDGRIWWHHMALVWAILFSKITPYVFSPKTPQLGNGPLIEEVRRLPWVKGTSENHGGCAVGLPFITMLSTTIIALLDSRSPLSIRAGENKHALGKPWTTKHGMSYKV
jgi:hypothetical protein